MSSKKLPEIIPVISQNTLILLPGTRLPISVEAETMSDNFGKMLKEHKYVGIIQPQRPYNQIESFSKKPDLYSIGCLGEISDVKLTESNMINLTVEGVSRFKVVDELSSDNPYRLFQVNYKNYPDDPDEANQKIDRGRFLGFVDQYLTKEETTLLLKNLKPLSDQSLINALCMSLELSSAEKQALLEAPDLTERADNLLTIFRMGFDFLKNEDPMQSNRLM